MELILIEGGNATVTPKQITAEDLIASATEKEKQKILEGNYLPEGWSKKFIAYIEAFPDNRRLCDIVYYHAFYPAYNEFRQRLSAYHTVGGREFIYTPWIIGKPWLSLLLHAFPGIMAVCMLITVFDTPFGTDTIVKLSLVAFFGSIFGSLLCNTLLRRQNDLAIAQEVREKAAEYRTLMDQQIEDYQKRLETDYAFYLEVLIKEMEDILQSLHSERKAVKDKLEELVNTPTRATQKTIDSINRQLQLFYILKSDLPEDEYIRKKAMLTRKRKALEESLSDSDPIKEAAKMELEIFQNTYDKVHGTIRDLRWQRQGLLNKEQLIKAINRNLEDEPIESGYVVQSYYHRELAVTLNRLKALNEAVSQIAHAAEESIKSLPQTSELVLLAS